MTSQTEKQRHVTKSHANSHLAHSSGHDTVKSKHNQIKIVNKKSSNAHGLAFKQRL